MLKPIWFRIPPLAFRQPLLALLLVALWPLCATPARATDTQAVISADAARDHYQRLLPTVMLFYDRERRAGRDTIEQFWQAGEFVAPDRSRAGLGLIEHPVWARFVIANNSALLRPLVLEYIDHGLPYMDLYSRALADSALQHHGHASYFKPFSQRPSEHLRYAYLFELQPYEQRVFYLRLDVQNAAPMFADMRLWQATAFERFKHRELFAFGALTGYLLMIWLIALTLYLSTRNLAALYYALFVASSLYGWGSVTGYLPEIFFREGYHWRHMIIGGALNISLSALFARSLLGTPKYLPRLDKALLALALFGLFPVLTALAEASRLAVLSMELQLLGMALLLVAGMLRAVQGDRQGWFFCLAWLCYIAAMITYPLRELGFIDHTPQTYWAGPLGAAIEVGLLLALLGRWIYRNEKTKQQARQAYLHALEDQKRQLELRVQQRTAEIEQARENAEREARTDSLTGLANRRQFMEQLAAELERHQRQQQPLSLLMIDLDHFKQINDRYGHAVGDLALQHTATIISSLIRRYDVLARLGGEEFALLMPNTALEQGRQLGERVRQQLANSVLQHGDSAIAFTLSAGLASAVPEDDASSLLARADRLLYQGKAQGRNRIIAERITAPPIVAAE